MKFDPMKPHPPVTSTFTAGLRGPFLGKRKTENGKRRRRAFLSDSRFPFPVSRPVSYESDLRVVADQEPVDPRPLVARVNAHVRPDERVRNSSWKALEA